MTTPAYNPDHPHPAEICDDAVATAYIHRAETAEVTTHTCGAVGRNGDLVMASQDVGRPIKSMSSDSRYEWWVTVRRKHLPRLLLELLKERFKSCGEFHSWLAEHAIASEFERAESYLM